ncbi:hypothetical protein G6N05_02765 [Flavobacterium sp. F372]|uniref:DUF4868 domain-containing protein n=1 Tax=Flavobacterium bernardetii TaxID=2813823 RepID=A0ABR7IVL4_9FLAO|nr:hypothetical protein [Flavobacterium bernardetii]MBC5833797.1 hypothetical protein [Flavobacterium bernardetii]NHF69030.1 hypothetical protein [Flavobacterium bernardetii]
MVIDKTSKKISYHIYKLYEGLQIENSFEDFDFPDFVTFLNSLNEEDRKMPITPKKYCALDFIEIIQPRYFQGRQKCFFGMIKSASFGTKKNLLDSLTNTERENPKELTEGEKEENYFVLAFKDNSEFEIILQNTHLGITSNHFKKYLDKFIRKYLSVKRIEQDFNTEMGDIIISDPNELIAQLDRIVECKVYMDKEVLGSNFLKLSNRTVQVKKDLIIDVRADTMMNIREFAKDVASGFASNTNISKVWICGKDNDKNVHKFFIERIMKSNHIKVTLDPTTKAIVKDLMKTEMIKLI